MLTRVLPGGVIVAAALAMPEFSVGAGDMGRGPQPADPPEPAAKPDPGKVQRLTSSAAPTHAKLAGVRYAPIIDLGTDTGHVARARVQAARPAAAPVGKTADSASSHAAFVQAFAEPVATPAPPAASAPAIDPQPAAAAVPQAAPALAAAPSAAPMAVELPEAPSKPAAAEADAMAFANLLPEERTALRAPAGTGAVPAVQPASRPAPAPAAVAAPVPAPARAATLAPAATQPAPRGMIDQVTPARIAAARALPAPATAPAPARAAPAPAPKAASLTAAAPAARAPAAVAPAPAAKPAPAAAAAVAPKSAPALTAPPAVAATAPRIADLEFKSRLLTRVDGRSMGQVDFQQTPAGIKVRLGSVAEVLADRLPAGELARIRNSSSADAWFSLAELQAQGIPISYDPVYDEFNIGREDTRPKAARKVHIDQISTPERSAGAATMDQIRRR